MPPPDPAPASDTPAPSTLPAVPTAPDVPPAVLTPAATVGGVAGTLSLLGVKRWRLATAWGVAVVSDALGLWLVLLPPVEWTLDGVTAIILWGLLGWRWWLLPGLLLEAVPGLQAFPFWVLVLGAVTATGKLRGMMAPPAK